MSEPTIPTPLLVLVDTAKSIESGYNIAAPGKVQTLQVDVSTLSVGERALIASRVTTYGAVRTARFADLWRKDRGKYLDDPHYTTSYNADRSLIHSPQNLLKIDYLHVDALLEAIRRQDDAIEAEYQRRAAAAREEEQRAAAKQAEEAARAEREAKVAAVRARLATMSDDELIATVNAGTFDR